MLLAIATTAISGCGFQVDLRTEVEFLIGGSADRVIFAKSFDSGYANVEQGFQVYNARFSVLNPATGTITQPDELAETNRASLSDGRWLALANYEYNVLSVVDIESGETTDVLPSGLSSGFQPIALYAGRLLAAAHYGGQIQLVLRDLNTGQQSEWLEDLVSKNGAAALGGDILALRVYPALAPSNPPSLDLSVATQIDYVNLATQARTTIATIADDHSGEWLAVGGRRIVWTEPGAAGLDVRVFDTANSQTNTLAVLATTDAGPLDRLDAVGAAGVVLTHSVRFGSTNPNGKTTVTGHRTLELVNFEGQSYFLTEFDVTSDDFIYESVHAAVIEQRVYYFNPRAGKWFSYDVDSDVTQEISPF